MSKILREKDSPSLPTSVTILFNEYVVTYRVDTPCLEIDEERTGSNDPSIAAVGRNVFSECYIGCSIIDVEVLFIGPSFFARR